MIILPTRVNLIQQLDHGTMSWPWFLWISRVAFWVDKKSMYNMAIICYNMDIWNDQLNPINHRKHIWFLGQQSTGRVMATTVISGLDGNDCEFLEREMCLNSLTRQIRGTWTNILYPKLGLIQSRIIPICNQFGYRGNLARLYCTCFHPEKLEFLALSVWFSLFDKGTGISLSRNKQRLLDEVSVVKKGCRLLFLEMYFCDSRFLECAVSVHEI